MRLCRGIYYIPKDIYQLQQELFESLKAVDQNKHHQKSMLTVIDQDKKEHLKRVQDCTERLIKHARDLEKTAVDDANSCYKTATDKLRSEIMSLDDAEMTINDRLKRLDNVNANSESQIFVDIKRGRQEVERARQMKQKLTSAPAGKVMSEFEVRDEVKYFLNKVQSMGLVVDKKVYTAALYGEYDVRMSEDTQKCSILDSCELPDGTILIVDPANGCVKKLDKSYNTVDRIEMPPNPCGICQTGEEEVAVTLTIEGKVQFVNVRCKLKMTKSFNVHEGCGAIMCSRNELFVGFWEGLGYHGFVGVHSMSGSPLRLIELDHRGQPIFTLPSHITSTNNGNKIHIADVAGGVITVDRQGHVLSKYSDIVQCTLGICAVPEDGLFVCGQHSNNVLQISQDRHTVAQLLGEEDGVKEPVSILLQRGGSKLIVTEAKSDNIKVFNLKL